MLRKITFWYTIVDTIPIHFVHVLFMYDFVVIYNMYSLKVYNKLLKLIVAINTLIGEEFYMFSYGNTPPSEKLRSNSRW